MTRETIINAFTVAKEGLELSPNNKTPMYAEAIELYASWIALLKTGLEFTEASYCVQIIKALLEAGYAVEVHDGQSYALNPCTNLYTIIQALNSTGLDTLGVYRRSRTGRLTLFSGWITLTYDNGGPEYLVSDYSDRPELEDILNRVYERNFSE